MRANTFWRRRISTGLLLWLGLAGSAAAQNIPVAHWINDSGQNGATVLNSGGVFTTDFKGSNDLAVTSLTSDSVDYYVDSFGGANPGNNPAYLTNFLGAAANGTGDGTTGDIVDLEMSGDNTGTVQFNFLTPLTPQDRILLIDVDGPEQYILQAYTNNGSVYTQTSFAGWTAQDFSGTTGETPNSEWPVWNPATGTLTSGDNVNLDEELFVLTPSQNISRLVVAKQTGSGWTTSITFVTPAPALSIARLGTNVVLRWSSPVFTLQAAPSLRAAFTNVPGATSPYTNAATYGAQFFRLSSN